MLFQWFFTLSFRRTWNCMRTYLQTQFLSECYKQSQHTVQDWICWLLTSLPIVLLTGVLSCTQLYLLPIKIMYMGHIYNFIIIMRIESPYRSFCHRFSTVQRNMEICFLMLRMHTPSVVNQMSFSLESQDSPFFCLWLGEHAQALPLLTALVHTGKYSQAGVWLKLAECRHMLGDLDASARAYSQVIALAPNHTESRWVHCGW